MDGRGSSEGCNFSAGATATAGEGLGGGGGGAGFGPDGFATHVLLHLAQRTARAPCVNRDAGTRNEALHFSQTMIIYELY